MIKIFVRLGDEIQSSLVIDFVIKDFYIDLCYSTT